MKSNNKQNVKEVHERVFGFNTNKSKNKMTILKKINNLTLTDLYENYNKNKHTYEINDGFISNVLDKFQSDNANEKPFFLCKRKNIKPLIKNNSHV